MMVIEYKCGRNINDVMHIELVWYLFINCKYDLSGTFSIKGKCQVSSIVAVLSMLVYYIET